MRKPRKILRAAFFVTRTGNRPVRDWLMELTPQDRKTIGGDIATLDFSWSAPAYRRAGSPACSSS